MPSSTVATDSADQPAAPADTAATIASAMSHYETYWCEDCFCEHTETHLECVICGEEIEPGTVAPSGFREFTPGPKSYYLNDEEITEERYREIITTRQEAADDQRPDPRR